MQVFPVFLCLSVFLSVCLYVLQSVPPSIPLSVHLFFFSIRLSICPIRPSIFLSGYSANCPSVSLSFYWFAHLPICPSAHLSAQLSSQLSSQLSAQLSAHLPARLTIFCLSVNPSATPSDCFSEHLPLLKVYFDNVNLSLSVCLSASLYLSIQKQREVTYIASKKLQEETKRFLPKKRENRERD
jgi:hypothetical protein